MVGAVGAGMLENQESNPRKSVERAIADRLITRNKLDRAALDRAIRLQNGSDERLEALLVKLGLASEKDVAEALAGELGLAIVEPSEYPETPVLENKFTAKFLKHASVLPLAETEDALILAMVDPLNEHAARAIEMASGRPIVRRLALPSDIETAYARLYGEKSPAQLADSVAEATSDEDFLEDVGRLRDLASEVPVIRLVNQMIS